MANEPDHSASADDSGCADAYLRMLCQHTGVAVVGTDADLRIQFWNRAASNLFGAAAEQMLGTSILSVIPADDRNQAECMLARALSKGEIGGFEFCYRDSQGEARQLAATVSPVVDDSGKVIGASACIRDITNRIILQEQVDRGKKMASMGAMAGAMAHYFNNILGGIITTVDFSLSSDHPAMQKRVLEKVATALARASQLSDSLLTFAEGDFRSADLADLTEVFLEVVHATETELGDSPIEFDAQATTIPVTAVPGPQFRTVLNNVIHNAIESMPDGGKLAVELGPTYDGYHVRVTDTGCGVSEELLDRVFEPFYSTKPVGRHESRLTRAGLGLAVAHGILQVMGGRISVRSRVGEGSTFTISLPATPRLPRPDRVFGV
ncbi:MAG: PAS domain S-box protein [bacterium]|nr:PAS domain S-box protein [bacterium]